MANITYGIIYQGYLGSPVIIHFEIEYQHYHRQWNVGTIWIVTQFDSIDCIARQGIYGFLARESKWCTDINFDKISKFLSVRRPNQI